MRGVRILKQKGDPFWAQSLTKLRFFELEQVGAGQGPWSDYSKVRSCTSG